MLRRLSAKNAKVVRPSLYNYIHTKEEFEYYANELFRLLMEEKFTVKIHEIYPLEDVARAHKVCFELLFIVSSLLTRPTGS